MLATYAGGLSCTSALLYCILGTCLPPLLPLQVSVVGLEAPGDPTVQWARRWSRAARSDLLNGFEVFDHALIHVSSARIAQDNDYGRLGLWLRSPTRGFVTSGVLV